jgi:hypothetical protein
MDFMVCKNYPECMNWICFVCCEQDQRSTWYDSEWQCDVCDPPTDKEDSEDDVKEDYVVEETVPASKKRMRARSPVSKRRKKVVTLSYNKAKARPPVKIVPPPRPPMPSINQINENINKFVQESHRRHPKVKVYKFNN